MIENFRERVLSRQPLLGAFLKCASGHVAEVMGHTSLDFLIADAEHASFGISDVDTAVLATLSAGTPCLVRPGDHQPAFISGCLDIGCAGVVAPHVRTAADANALIGAMKYAKGQRGYSPSTRAAKFGAALGPAFRATMDARTALWCQIEDADALPMLDDIAGTEGVDCLFVGRADLALSLGVETNDHPSMQAAIEAIVSAARRHGVALGFYVGNASEIGPLLDLGATVFACGSDQSYLTAQASTHRAGFDQALAGRR